jgi:hypothetical protein
MTSLEPLNQALFLTLNANASTPAWELNLAAVAADDFIYAIPVFLAGLWFWGSMEQRALALKACAVAFISLGVNQLLGFVCRIRGPLCWDWALRLSRTRPIRLFRVTTPRYSPPSD